MRSLIILALTATLTGCATMPRYPVDARRLAVEQGLLPAVVRTDRSGGLALHERMARYGVPGVGIAVVDDCRLGWSAGYGVRSAGGSEPVDSHTVFQAASISKLVTAVGAMRMVDRGALALDGDVNLGLARWRLPVSAGPVTLRHLLAHAGGVNVPSFQGYAAGDDLPDLLQVLQGTSPANSPPIQSEGPLDVLAYSGGGYQVVELLMEEASGRPFTDLMSDLVLAPAGMELSTFEAKPPPGLAAEAAFGHSFDGAPHEGGWSIYPQHAAASLWSSPEDLARLSIALMRSWEGETGALISREAARSMLTPYVEGMGLGPGVHGEGETLHFDHAGWTRGYRAYLLGWPSQCDAVVVMTNADGGDELIAEIVRAVASVYGWPGFAPRTVSVAAPTPESLDALSGRYRLNAGFDVAVRRDGDSLVIQTPRGSTYTLIATGERSFVTMEEGAEVHFGVGDLATIQLWGMSGTRASGATASAEN